MHSIHTVVMGGLIMVHRQLSVCACSPSLSMSALLSVTSRFVTLLQKETLLVFSKPCYLLLITEALY